MNGNEVGATKLAYLRGEKDLLKERDRVAQMRKQFQDLGLAFWLNNAQKRRVERFWQVATLLQENSRMSLDMPGTDMKRDRHDLSTDILFPARPKTVYLKGNRAPACQPLWPGINWHNSSATMH